MRSATISSQVSSLALKYCYIECAVDLPTVKNKTPGYARQAPGRSQKNMVLTPPRKENVRWMGHCLIRGLPSRRLKNMRIHAQMHFGANRARIIAESGEGPILGKTIAKRH